MITNVFSAFKKYPAGAKFTII